MSPVDQFLTHRSVDFAHKYDSIRNNSSRGMCVCYCRLGFTGHEKTKTPNAIARSLLRKPALAIGLLYDTRLVVMCLHRHDTPTASEHSQKQYGLTYDLESTILNARETTPKQH